VVKAKDGSKKLTTTAKKPAGKQRHFYKSGESVAAGAEHRTELRRLERAARAALMARSTIGILGMREN
jgi:hypothetical protein